MEVEQLLERYWELAYHEGKTGESRGTEAGAVLHAIRQALKAAPAPKSMADCATGPCECDPHLETCHICAPFLHKSPAEAVKVPEWQPIETAPRETELLVGRFVNNEWRICQSGFYFDSGNELEGEPSYWLWYCDWDNGGATDDPGPTHWMPLPAAPQLTEKDGGE